MFAGRLLLDEGWTFEVSFDPAPDPAVDFQAPGSILVIAPDFVDMAPIGTSAHLRALAQVFDSLSPGHGVSSRFQVVKTPAQVERALAGMRPDTVYYYGHGAIDDDQLRLELGDGRREPMLMRDLGRLLRQTPPSVVFLNGCQTGQAGWHSAGAQLLPKVPLVIANATSAWSESAGRLALRWFGDWLGKGLDPVAALHRLGGRASTQGFEWVTPIVHAHYNSFDTRPPSAAIQKVSNLSVDRLDREEQRARVFGYISELGRDPRRRVMAAVAYAAPGNHLELLPSQISARVESDAGERLHIQRFHLRFPEQRAIKDLAANLESGLKIQLRYETATPIEHILRASAPPRSSGAVSVLWLDWGVFGEPPSRQPALSPDQVTEWVKFVRNQIASVCPDDLRIVATVALEVEAEKLPRLGSRLAAFEADPQFRNARFRFRTIPPLTNVDLSEILDYLEQADCPTDIAYGLAKLVLDKTLGHYEATVSLLRRGPPAWYPLHDELRGGTGAVESAETW
jgi:hypothetical protein